MNNKLGSSVIYLTEEQYCQVRIPWFKNHEVDYLELCKLWSLSAFRVVSEKKRLYHGKESKDRYDTDRHVRKSQHMAIWDGVVSSDIEVFIEHHRGTDPLNLDQLCSQSATDHLKW